MTDPARFAWMDHAACRGVDPDLFFPRHGGSAGQDVRIAKQTCDVCPVRLQCLNYGLHERYGVWGGLTERERRRLARARSRCVTDATHSIS